MEDKLEEVIKQYPFHVYSRWRTRGAFLLETDEGLLLLKECSASQPRILFEESVKEQLKQQGYEWTDVAYKNNHKEHLSKDRYRNQWIVRRWYEGEECDIKEQNCVLRSAAHLGKLHKMMMSEAFSKENYIQKEGIREEMERHNKELKRVRSYIRGKKRKNEMEICLLNSFDIYYDQACLAQTLLQESGYDDLWQRTVQQGRLVHGSYTYHNILFHQNEIITTNFDRTEVGIQVRDLYDFLRKVMEKNAWRPDLGLKLIDHYQTERELEPAEGILLYAMLFYPEKYWKLVNFYYNSRKSWMSARNLEKLIKIRAQEEGRMVFLGKVKKLFIS